MTVEIRTRVWVSLFVLVVFLPDSPPASARPPGWRRARDLDPGAAPLPRPQ